jgi:hypothetical protein
MTLYNRANDCKGLGVANNDDPRAMPNLQPRSKDQKIKKLVVVVGELYNVIETCLM